MSDMPSALDAEQQVLGAALVDGAVLDGLQLVPGDFYRPAHAQLWALMTEMRAKGEPTEPLAVLSRLDGRIKGVDGVWLHGLYSGCVSTVSAPFYAAQVREASDLRRVREAGGLLLDATGSAEDVKARARRILDGIDSRDASTVRLGQVIDDVLDEASDQTPARVAPTPWPEVDEVITGLRPGTVMTVGGRPGTGKSVLGASLAWHVALGGQTALLFSLEMSRQDVARRMVSAVAAVDYGRLLRRRVSEVEWQRISRARLALEEAPFVIDDRSGITPAQIAATVRAHARGEDLGVVVVDYLQLVAPPDRRLPREQQVSECSRAMKVLAGDLQVPVVLLSQLNRAVEARADKHPLLSDLRESGSLEQDSDVVLLLYRDVEQAPESLDVGVAKNRFGVPTAVRLCWEGQFQRVLSPALSSQAGRWAS